MVEDISEVPHVPKKRDWSFYFVLVFLVGPIWIVVPLSWLFVAYSASGWRFLTYGSKEQTFLACALVEVAFSVYYYVLAQKISGPSPNGPANLVELQNAYKRMLQSGLASLPADGGDEENLYSERPGSPAEVIENLETHDHRAIDFRNRMRTWFRKVPWSHISLEHIHSWLYWSTYNTAMPHRDHMPKSHRTVIDEAVQLLEKRSGSRFPATPKSAVTPLLLTIDPVNIAPRPLSWYLFVRAANICLRRYYEFMHGLTYGRFQELEYLVYMPPNYSRQKGPEPIVLLHGLGLGVLQYQQALSHILSELPDAPLLIPIQPQISQDIFHPRYLKPILRHEKVACLAGLLEKLGWAGTTDSGESFGVTVVSHSNGSYAHAWMLKAFPELITRSCFVDPVTFCLWEGDVCYNFVYRPCTTGVELVVRYFVGMELGVANLIQRHFDWLSNTLWFEEIPNARDPRKTFYLLGGKDCIVDSERVKLYLTSHGVRQGLWYDPDGRHGQAMIAGAKGMRRVIEWLEDNPGKKHS